MTEDHTILSIQPAPPPTSPPKPKRNCCLWGCLGGVGLIAVSVICLFTLPILLRAVGLINPPAEVVYGGAPDRYASAQVEDTLRQAAIEGVKVYVIPEQGTNNQTAFIILDSSSGFDGFEDLDQTATEPMVDGRVDDLLADLAARNQTENLRITRVAIDYRDENGDTFMTLTTTITEIEDYLAGRITQEEFHGQLGIGLGDLLNQVIDEYNE